jgi:pimeloyl-ACP methyl ester carboxylesterase
LQDPLMWARMASLARWLGPWADPARAPAGITRRLIPIPGRPDLRAALFLPGARPIERAWIIAPGLHFLGPDDPRLDRFARVLAAQGALVMAPFVPDYLALRVTERAVDDFQACFRALLARPELPPGCKPSAWSVSFGSLLALRLASAPALAERVGGLMTFGGFADWEETVRFCLTGEAQGQPPGAYDTLNRPVIWINLLPELGAPDDPAPLIAAWMDFIRATWSAPHQPKRPQEAPQIAHALADALCADLRELFLDGCGVTPQSTPRGLDALARSRDRFAWIDPRQHLAGLRCPVHLAHGANDDVIPVNQLDRLAAAIPAHVPVSCWKTGVYGHTAASPSPPLAAARAALREAGVMRGMLAALASGADAARR